MWGARVTCEVYFLFMCIFINVYTSMCFFSSINAFYKANVAFDCLCLGFHFFNKGSYAIYGVFVLFPIWRQNGI
jgi:hypothetical protein